MRKADIIASDDEGKVALRPWELDKCLSQGECVQCGVCCITYVTRVPERKPEDAREEVRTEYKAAMEPCKYLTEDGSGRFGCACHEVKDNPSLAVCDGWRGNLHGEFENMMLNYVANLVSRGVAEDIMMTDTLCRRGSIAELQVFHLPSIYVRDFLFQSLHCPKLPFAMWDKMGLKEYFWRMRRAEFEELYMNRKGVFCLDPENPAHQAFAEACIPFDPFKKELAETDFPQSAWPASAS